MPHGFYLHWLAPLFSNPCLYPVFMGEWRRNMKRKAVCDNKLVTVAKLLSILANICLTFPTFQNCLSTFTLINSTLLIHYFSSWGLYIPTKHVWCMGIACNFYKIQARRCDVSRAIEHPMLFAASSHSQPRQPGAIHLWQAAAHLCGWSFSFHLSQCQHAVHVHGFMWLHEVGAQVLKHFTLPTTPFSFSDM